jgi:predicted dehydrogenase
MHKIRLGIIGCGGMGTRSHVKGLLALQDRMTVAATCDIEIERAKAVATAVGAQMAVSDFRELLEHVDAVLVALPHDLHFPIGLSCLEAGKHVLMEKPLCNTEEQCIRLIEEAERCKLTLMTAYPVPFWPIIRKMLEFVENKTYGEVFQLSVWTEQYTIRDPGHWILSAERLGGGQFFSHGCHYIDLMFRFLGRPVKGVHMGSNKGTPWMEKEGTSNVTIEFENGAMGYHFGTWGARGTRLGWSLHVHCTEGMLEYNRKDNKLFLHSNLRKERGDLVTRDRTRVLMEDDQGGKGTQYETAHFLDCIATGQRPITDGTTSLQGLRAIWRLYEADRANAIADLRSLGLDEDWKAEAASGRIIK